MPASSQKQKILAVTMKGMLRTWDEGACYQMWGGLSRAWNKLRPNKVSASSAYFANSSVLSPQSHLLTEGTILGEGAFGTVLSVKEAWTGESYALKIAKTDDTRGQRTEMLVSLRFQKNGWHENILRTYAMDDRHWQKPILSALAKSDMIDIASGRDRTTTAEGVKILLGIARGLHHAHALVGAKGSCMGMIHCDIKPANIMMFPDRVPKIGDWGLARTLFDSRNGHGSMGGSPPEVLREPNVLCHQRQDVYTFGVLMMIMLLRKPFKSINFWVGQDLELYIFQKGAHHDNLLRPRFFPGDLPHAPRAIDEMRRMLDPNPASRTQDMEIVIDLLERMTGCPRSTRRHNVESPKYKVAVTTKAAAVTPMQPAPVITSRSLTSSFVPHTVQAPVDKVDKTGCNKLGLPGTDDVCQVTTHPGESMKKKKPLIDSKPDTGYKPKVVKNNVSKPDGSIFSSVAPVGLGSRKASKVYGIDEVQHHVIDNYPEYEYEDDFYQHHGGRDRGKGKAKGENKTRVNGKCENVADGMKRAGGKFMTNGQYPTKERVNDWRNGGMITDDRSGGDRKQNGTSSKDVKGGQSKRYQPNVENKGPRRLDRSKQQGQKLGTPVNARKAARRNPQTDNRVSRSKPVRKQAQYHESERKRRGVVGG